jgi:multicomponent Na+:H+ antiporter subunit E
MTPVITRAACFFGFWLILTGLDPGDAPAGLAAAAIATWTSLRLLPAGDWRLRPITAARFVLHFLHQSVAAGVDVAWRALDPRAPLRPGFIVYRPRLPPRPARHAFCTLTSLLPGTLPSGPDATGAIVVHCLDASQPVAAQLAAEEAALIQAFGGKPSDG